MQCPFVVTLAHVHVPVFFSRHTISAVYIYTSEPYIKSNAFNTVLRAAVTLAVQPFNCQLLSSASTTEVTALVQIYRSKRFTYSVPSQPIVCRLPINLCYH